jgi:hypothetical protein
LPIQKRQRRLLRLQTSVGNVVIETWYGWDRLSEAWINPTRLLLGLEPHQELSSELEDRACFVVTWAPSYQAASELLAKFDVPISDSTLHTLVARRGQRAQAQSEQRVDRFLDPQSRPQAIKQCLPQGRHKEFSLILMMDAWKGRYRGANWGQHAPSKKEDHVRWQDIKSAVIYRLDHHVQKPGGRGIISQKSIVSYHGEPEEFGRRVHAQALRAGLTEAKQVFVVADGAVWIWKIAEDRFAEATHVLDYYHASQHLWAVANELFTAEERAQALRWINPLLEQIHEGRVAKVIGKLEDLPGWCARQERKVPELLETEINYLKTHQPRMHYPKIKEQGAPIGSGAMESLCSQLQGRFKRTGQFWTETGFDNLMALTVARRNHDWNQIWSEN